MIAIHADDQRAEGANHKAQSEHEKRLDQADSGAPGRKEISADVHRKQGIHGKIVPLEQIADGGCQDGTGAASGWGLGEVYTV
jgi:hypothetical protein